MHQAPESTAKKAFDFNSTVDSRRLSTQVYHSAHGISNILPYIPCRQTATWLADSQLRGLVCTDAALASWHSGKSTSICERRGYQTTHRDGVRRVSGWIPTDSSCRAGGKLGLVVHMNHPE
eukprot:1188392-Prorocentrum_minimum.AAC.3